MPRARGSKVDGGLRDAPTAGGFHETAFRVLAKIAKLEVFETETFPAEDIKVFWKELV
jgi:hypothetical protein